MSFEARKVRTGKVVSDSMDKTIVVSVVWKRPHKLYKKSVSRRSRMTVHDADNVCSLGDVVQIVESRPISKTKKWNVKSVLSRAEFDDVRPEDVVADADVMKSVVDSPNDIDQPVQDSVVEETNAVQSVKGQEPESIGQEEQLVNVPVSSEEGEVEEGK